MSVEPSLKAFLEEFGARNDISVPTLISQFQRMYRAGKFEKRPGHGPGSGVPLAAENVAKFFVWFMATRNPVDAAEIAGKLK